MGSSVIPVLHMGKPRHRVVNQTTDSQWSNWDLNLSPVTPGLECCVETWAGTLKKSQSVHSPPLATQRHPGLERGTGPPGYYRVSPSSPFFLTPHPTSHHKLFKMSKGKRMEPELLAGLPDFGLLGSALSVLLVWLLHPTCPFPA